MPVLLVVLGILLFGFLIAIHEFGHFITAKLAGVRVNEFSIGMGPKLWSKQGSETLYSLRLFPIGGFCAMEGEDEDSDDPRSFPKAKAWKKFLILAAGAFMNFVAGLLIFVLLAASSPWYITPVVAGYLPGYDPDPASPRLEMGDRILAVDGNPIFVGEDVSLFFNRGDDDLDLVVRRNGKRGVLKDVYMPFYRCDGDLVRGIQLSPNNTTLFSALCKGWGDSIDTVRLVWLSLGDLFSGAVGIRDMSGPVGIVDMMGQTVQRSENAGTAAYNVFYLVAFIAINLAVMNLLPIPALDGGRIFFLVINLIYTAVTKRKLDPKYEGVVNTVCLVALLGLMVVVAASDILKLFGR